MNGPGRASIEENLGPAGIVVANAGGSGGAVLT
jgi:hypothetical protein